MFEEHLIVGLGNPGKEYQSTRHNCGFMIVQALAEQHQIKLTRSPKHKALIGQGTIEGINVVLLLPQTFMNNSGFAVKSVVSQKGIAMERILVLCDDFHLGFGQLRLKARGSEGGHNGLASVIQELGTREFARLRVGVGELQAHQEASDFVLTPFSRREMKEFEEVIQEAVRCCTAFLSVKLNQAMNLFNQRKENE